MLKLELDNDHASALRYALGILKGQQYIGKISLSDSLMGLLDDVARDLGVDLAKDG